MQRDILDKWKDATEIVKNIGSILGVTLVVVVVWSSSSDIKMTIIKLSEFVGLKLYNELNTPERLIGQEEGKVPHTIGQAARLLMTGQENVWMYAGATHRNTKEPWIETNISLSAVPQPGDLIKTTNDVFERTREPQLIRGEWLKGEIQGVLQKGETATVQNIIDIPGIGNTSLWWIEVDR